MKIHGFNSGAIWPLNARMLLIKMKLDETELILAALVKTSLNILI